MGTKTITRLALLLLGITMGALPAVAQSDRVVALVISEGDGARRADAIQARLHLMGLETLRSNDPSNAELRSILIRFSREAEDSRATFVFLDLSVVDFDGRSFVLPANVALEQATDLFTQGIPVQAFSRSAAQAKQGGAVVIIVEPPSQTLPPGLSTTKRAPDPIPGSSPILVAAPDSFIPILSALQGQTKGGSGDLGDILRRMARDTRVTISNFPPNPILINKSADAAPEPDSIVIAQAVPASDQTSDTLDQGAQAAPEELALLERSLSRAAKRSIQRALRGLGFYQGLVDGIFGPQTRAAIKAFQVKRSEEGTGVLTRRQLLDLAS
ncbi:peptidoglycan-binding domain-containing protein [Rhodospirillum sp. A1_3_36]|uniref:peptidoglycan-binding domain-containing protein n=1 Tax=Rhodospirillum sp. A1_3_36 TaxID=3391666 RepID=UPI0039A4822B